MPPKRMATEKATPKSNTETRATPKRKSTSPSRRISYITSSSTLSDSTAQTPQPKRRARKFPGRGHDISLSSSSDNQEEEEAETKPSTTAKKREQEPATRPPAPKRRKPSPPVPTPAEGKEYIAQPTPHRLRPINAEPTSSASTQTMASVTTNSNNIIPAAVPLPTIILGMLAYLDLLHPYMAFQLSLSGLQGSTYDTAHATMREVDDVVSRLKMSAGDVKEGGEYVTEEEENVKEKRGGMVERNKKKTKKTGMIQAKIIARKQKETTEVCAATRRRKLVELFGEDAVDTNVDTEDADGEAHPDSALWDNNYQARHSSTDTAESESTGEDTDVIERREMNALRRRKALQKRRTEGKDDVNSIVKKVYHEKTAPLVEFCAVEW
ncbi:hypothetical protein EJ02DRAFT_418600 [Clathrospora elynae]|uniref:Uncharacterized protein n=1 Tax=Clathrospora elynae TaxID=706981 RepID=A0A6A5T3P5_9PLEO|nr:hypothetical protein EJ02DRAFT_418600 [Clathrospora elynae]